MSGISYLLDLVDLLCGGGLINPGLTLSAMPFRTAQTLL